MDFAVYIMTNYTNKVLYIGVTNNLERRVAEHKSGAGSVFSQKYKVNKLVYYKIGDFGLAAIAHEKELKGWTRAKKIKLIESFNPDWHDLSFDLFE